MTQTILFSEIKNQAVANIAAAFAKNPENKVYALQAPGEFCAVKSGQQITLLEIPCRRQDAIGKALEQMAEEIKSVDMLVLSAGSHCPKDGDILEQHDYQTLLDIMDENVIGNLEVVKASLELLRRGEKKRVALLTEKAGSINLNQGTEDFGHLMSLASLHMMEKVLFNTLRPEGFTFRCIAIDRKGGMAPDIYLQMNLSDVAGDDYIHADENRLVMRDQMMCEVPW